MKKLWVLLISFFIMIGVHGCNSDKPQILFNKHPFSQETMMATTNVFPPSERIYYLITVPKTIKSKKIFIQIVKLGSEERLGYNLVWSKHVKLKEEQIYYYTDYVVLNETGAYLMKTYSNDEPTKILTTSQFYIRN